MTKHQAIKTTPRMVRFWRNLICAAYTALLLVLAVIVAVVVAGQSKDKLVSQLNILNESGFNWQANDVALVFNPSIFANFTELVLHKADQPDADKFILVKNPHSFDWQGQIKRHALDQNLSISAKYVILSASYLLWAVFSLVVIWMLGLVTSIVIADRIESRLFALERRARKMGLATRKSEHIRFRSLVQLLDSLLDELHYARQEQSRLDKYIRSQAFIDPDIGIGNQVYFDNRLEAVLQEAEQINSGAVMLMQLNQLDVVEEEYSLDTANQVMTQFANIILQSLKRLPDAILARRAFSEFALLIPAISHKESEQLAQHLLRALAQVRLPKKITPEDFYHLGITCFSSGEQSYQVLSEADMALRAAQLQGPNGWFVYEDDNRPGDMAMGSVRWRSFLENALTNESFVLFFQPVLTTLDSAVHHQEVLARIRDVNGNLLNAGMFLPMARKCGLVPQIDRLIMNKLFVLFEQDASSTSSCSINLHTNSLLNDVFFDWLVDEISAVPERANRLILEIGEYPLKQHEKKLAEPLAILANLGVRLLIDQVGQYVINSSYIKDYPIAYLKLHSSIVRNIHERLENQVFVRSLLSTCKGTNVRLFAFGLESKQEWEVLKILNIHGAQGHYFNEPIAALVQADKQAHH